MTENTETVDLPSYAKPPVVETIIGVQFDRLPKFSNAHLGAFWQTLDVTKWPNVSDAASVPVQFEEFSEETKWVDSVRLQFKQDPAARLQIKNKLSDRMIQVQNGRFHFNWLGEAGGEYPRYNTVLAEFNASLSQYVKYLEESQLGKFSPNQWEITYINHIPVGTVWSQFSEWNFFRPLGTFVTLKNGLTPGGFSGQWQYEIPMQKGRLHITWQLAKKTQGPIQDEFIQLSLTARGPLPYGSDGTKSLSDGLNLGHETIVVAFHELMTAKANRFWGG